MHAYQHLSFCVVIQFDPSAGDRDGLTESRNARTQQAGYTLRIDFACNEALFLPLDPVPGFERVDSRRRVEQCEIVTQPLNSGTSPISSARFSNFVME